MGMVPPGVDGPHRGRPRRLAPDRELVPLQFAYANPSIGRSLPRPGNVKRQTSRLVQALIVKFGFVSIDGCDEIEGVAVVIDVLRAFSFAAFALDAGAERLILMDDLDTTLELAARLPGALAGKDGRPQDGFDLFNSPGQLLERPMSPVGRSSTAPPPARSGRRGPSRAPRLLRQLRRRRGDRPSCPRVRPLRGHVRDHRRWRPRRRGSRVRRVPTGPPRRCLARPRSLPASS